MERIRAALLDEGCDAQVREIRVPDAETALRVRFLGSPTVRINGVDIEPGVTDEGRDFPIICRYYLGGAPSYELIRAAVRSASSLRKSEERKAMKQNPIVIGSSLGAIASGFAVVATTFCCAGPAVAAFIGTGGVLMGARPEPFRLYFVLGSIALLGVGFWLAYRPKGGCIGRTCTTTNARITRAILWIGALLTGGALLFSKFLGG